ncbi:sulfatase-like hydrolase/transferase [Ectothiorhodospira lacustris]|uniref:sulfatase-like hydrolase/transferase n=1 Tax=Ectothiorhodospira lacustris TaxID=2899127 RepID=UPI001EE9671E|nr:sulfatase-like hydrolase/transferase [Ectothiorhodospira lacustris]MCG5521895.1 sulfatase-like hydrolase/transferase [Ectothiorhodospira lacustris]
MKTYLRTACLLVLLMGLGACSDSSTQHQRQPPPNILFIVLDDVGIDQLNGFNSSPLAVTPQTPSIDTIAGNGVSFASFYTMPECSPSRVSFFTGRYPFRTGVNAAILPDDLPSAQISPFEETIPKVLATRGYTSAMIGKYHLGGPELNPDGYLAPSVMGWDYYAGNIYGGPPPLDTTIGGQYDADTFGGDPERFSCGVPLGPTRGVCWREDPGQTPQMDYQHGAGYTGKECLALGGIPALDADGQFATTLEGAAAGSAARELLGMDPYPDFSIMNGFYVWLRTEVAQGVLQQSLSREYMTVAETDASIDWIRAQTGQGPWMLTVSYSAAHVPFQPPPDNLLPHAGIEAPNCTGGLAQRLLGNQMIEAMDKEIGRLLVGAGLAVQADDGSLEYTPEGSNTVVILIGDNGTFIPIVKPPYNPTRSKGTIYETGVRAPMIVAGPGVVQPGRTVDDLVSVVDLFQLFGEIAGIDVHDAVPSRRTLDSQPVLPYLRNADQDPIRSTVFMEIGGGQKPSGMTTPPCVLSFSGANICTDILFVSEQMCRDTGGTPFGPEGAPPAGLDGCCAVRDAALYDDLTIVPLSAWAIRNARYKLISNERAPCDGPPLEFYDLQATSLTNPAGLDNPEDELLQQGPLNADAQESYTQLYDTARALLASEVDCPGDGNLDKRVDQRDLDGVEANFGGPSVFDFNNDGVTDELDRSIVEHHFLRDCSVPGPLQAARE